MRGAGVSGPPVAFVIRLDLFVAALVVASVAIVMVLSACIEDFALRDIRRRKAHRRQEMPAE
jgi:hypothetical protein